MQINYHSSDSLLNRHLKAASLQHPFSVFCMLWSAFSSHMIQTVAPVHFGEAHCWKIYWYEYWCIWYAKITSLLNLSWVQPLGHILKVVIQKLLYPKYSRLTALLRLCEGVKSDNGYVHQHWNMMFRSCSLIQILQLSAMGCRWS